MTDTPRPPMTQSEPVPLKETVEAFRNYVNALPLNDEVRNGILIRANLWAQQASAAACTQHPGQPDPLAEDPSFKAWLVSHDSGMHWGCGTETAHVCRVQQLAARLGSDQPVLSGLDALRTIYGLAEEGFEANLASIKAMAGQALAAYAPIAVEAPDADIDPTCRACTFKGYACADHRTPEPDR